MRPILVACTASLATALACVAATAPDWIGGRSEAYPRETHWIGVGDGDDLESARNRARAEIARRFEVRVLDSVTDSATQDRDASGRSEVSERLVVETRTETDAVVEGVEIVESWVDPATARHHVLAALDLRRAHRRYRERADQHDRKAASLAASARAADASLDATRFWLQAVAAARERDAWLRRAALVSGGAGVSAGAAGSTGDLEAELARAVERVRFDVSAVEVEPGGERELPEFADAIAELLTSLGFQASRGEGPLRVGCRLELRSVDRGDPRWHHVLWDGACGVSRAGRVWIAATRSGSESHPSAETARTKARLRAREQLVEALRARLVEALHDEG